MNASDTAKVFTTGRSQAVRLPKAYRFNTKEVLIERQGDAVILRPKLDKNEWWAEMVMVTNNVREFQRIDGLKLENWADA